MDSGDQQLGVELDAATRARRPLGAALAVAFFLVGLASLDDYGITWDESNSYVAGLQNLEMVRGVLVGEETPDWPFQEIPGYQFVFDALRSLFATQANALFFEPISPLGFHLFNLLLASASLWLLYRLIFELTGRNRIALLGALALAAFPKFLAHSQNNPKDLIALFCFNVSLLLVVRAACRPLRFSVPAGLGLGLALASHVLSVFAIFIAAVWMLAVGKGAWRQRFLRLATVAAVAAPTALICWPWLWAETGARLQWMVEHLTSFTPDEVVLYLGTLYPRADPPWHYSPVLLAASTPLLFLITASIGAFQIRPGAAGRRLAQLALLWVAVLLVSDLLAPSHYGGVRHLLPILPPMAGLVALGINTVWERIRSGSRLAGSLLGIALAAGSVALAVDLVRSHPYHDAYLNVVGRFVWADEPERSLELEVWGGVYKEGAEWLLEHAERGGAVVVPIASHCTLPYLEDRMPVYEMLPSEVEERPIYLMVMTRVSEYTPLIRRATEQLDPIFSVRRGNATYLEIYRLLDGASGSRGGNHGV